jgi:N-acetylglucosaminyl-diphospho-decaprenol L-rhamnosyltransferase
MLRKCGFLPKSLRPGTGPAAAGVELDVRAGDALGDRMSDSGMLDCRALSPCGANGSAGDSNSVTGRPSASNPHRGNGAAAPPSGPIDISVCIANWNCRELLRSCLESLLDQPQGVRLETIVVDNASTDGAADMVAQHFPEVTLLRNPTNVGFARANNQAAGQARGRYLFFLNNDTRVPPGALRRLFEYAMSLRDAQGTLQVSYRARPTVATLLHRTSLLRWTGLFRPVYRSYRRNDFDPGATREVDTLMGAAMLMPREVFQSCGGWDESYTFGVEDLDLSTRVGRQYALIYHPEVEIIHYGRVSSRQHIGYVSSHMAAGFVHYLRTIGTSAPAVWGYKLVVTLDAPVQLLTKGVQFLWRRARGRQQKAENSLLALRGVGHFLTRGLVRFWRA